MTAPWCGARSPRFRAYHRRGRRSASGAGSVLYGLSYGWGKSLAQRDVSRAWSGAAPAGASRSSSAAAAGLAVAANRDRGGRPVSRRFGGDTAIGGPWLRPTLFGLRRAPSPSPPIRPAGIQGPCWFRRPCSDCPGATCCWGLGLGVVVMAALRDPCHGRLAWPWGFDRSSARSLGAAPGRPPSTKPRLLLLIRRGDPGGPCRGLGNLLVGGGV